jgi:hypothetical protein
MPSIASWRVAVGIYGHGVTFVQDRPLAPGGLLERRDDQHPRPDTRSVHAVAHGDDATDALRAEPRGELRAHPIDTPDQVQIRRVDRRRLNRHRQLARARIRRINLGELDDLGRRAEARKLKRLHGNRLLCRWSWLTVRSLCDRRRRRWWRQ